MTKKTVSRYAIGILALLSVFSGCASNKGYRMDFTPGALKNDIGIQNLSQTQFFLSEGVSIKYTRVTRTPVIGKNGVVKVKIDTFTRTFKIRKETPGILRTMDNAGNPVAGWRVAPSPYTGRDKATIQLLFLRNNDNYLEFEAYYDGNFDDKFSFLAVSFSDTTEKIPPISVSLTDSDDVVKTRETYLDAEGNQVSEPTYSGDVPVILETFTIDTIDTIETESNTVPYLQYKLSEQQKPDTKTKNAPGRKI